MAFCLGSLNENEGYSAQAVKFFKRFFFCARMLDDPVGASSDVESACADFFSVGGTGS